MTDTRFKNWVCIHNKTIVVILYQSLWGPRAKYKMWVYIYYLLINFLKCKPHWCKLIVSLWLISKLFYLTAPIDDISLLRVQSQTSL
jgi:hypothetical protein